MFGSLFFVQCNEYPCCVVTETTSSINHMSLKGYWLIFSLFDTDKTKRTTVIHDGLNEQTKHICCSLFSITYSFIDSGRYTQHCKAHSAELFSVGVIFLMSTFSSVLPVINNLCLVIFWFAEDSKASKQMEIGQCISSLSFKVYWPMGSSFISKSYLEHKLLKSSIQSF